MEGGGEWGERRKRRGSIITNQYNTVSTSYNIAILAHVAWRSIRSCARCFVYCTVDTVPLHRSMTLHADVELVYVMFWPRFLWGQQPQQWEVRHCDITEAISHIFGIFTVHVAVLEMEVFAERLTGNPKERWYITQPKFWKDVIGTLTGARYLSIPLGCASYKLLLGTIMVRVVGKSLRYIKNNQFFFDFNEWQRIFASLSELSAFLNRF